MDPDGKNQRNLTDNPAGDLYPAWSPDGRKIAFHSLRDGSVEIYVMDADGENPVRLTNNALNVQDGNPVWSPDGQSIVFDSFRDGNFEIYIMDADGKDQRNLTNSPATEDMNPDWFDPAYAAQYISPAGKLATTWGNIK